MPGLFGSTILDVAVGMVFVYLLLSLITSSINELLAGFLKLRSRDLASGIANMLCDPELTSRVMHHPLIKAMGSTRTETAAVQFAAGGDVGAVASGIRKLLGWLWRPFKLAQSFVVGRKDFAGTPSYVPARTFANALLDALDPARPGTILTDVVVGKAQELANGTAPVTDELTSKVEKLLKPAAEVLAQIQTATTLAELRAVVEQVTGGDATAKQLSLAAIDSKLEIGQALGSILDVSLTPDQAIISVAELKSLIERLPDAGKRQQILDVIGNADTLDAVKKAVGLLPDDLSGKKMVLDAVEGAQAGLENFRRGIETWYDDTMDRVSGIYKRRVRWWLLAIGAVVVAALGADTIEIYRTLSTNPTARAAAVAQAENALEPDWCLPTPTPTATSEQIPEPAATPAAEASPAATDEGEPTQGQSLDCLVDRLDEANLGFGYGGRPAFDVDSSSMWWWYILKAIGLVMTTIAVALGAPFWFDVLSKISNLRAVGPKPAKAATEEKTHKP